MYNNEMSPQWLNNSKEGHSKLERESLVPEYTEHWLCYIIVVIIVYTVERPIFCKLMTQQNAQCE